MKTKFLKIATLLFMLSAGKNVFATNSGQDQLYTELSWINNFYKIEVHGNVQLHLLSGDKCKVEMNSTYFDHNALVQVEKGVLRITCYRTERLNVWVTTNDLHALSAYDNVLVQTEGEFSSLEFDVELFDKAKADLNLDCFAANVKLNDRSMANLTGTAIESDLTTNYAATLNAVAFNADQLARERINPIWENRIQFPEIRNNALLTNFPDERPDFLPAINELRFSSTASEPAEFKIPAQVNRINVTNSLTN